MTSSRRSRRGSLSQRVATGLAYLSIASGPAVLASPGHAAPGPRVGATQVTGGPQTGGPVGEPERLGGSQGDRPRSPGGDAGSAGGSGGADGGVTGGLGADPTVKDVGGGLAGVPGGAGGPGSGPAIGGLATTTDATFALSGEAAPWLAWWDLNRHRFVDPRAALRRAGTTTGSSDFFLGEGETRGPATPAAELPELLLPALLLAATDADARLAVEALLALGALSEHFDADARASVRLVLRDRAADANLWVSGAAVHALARGPSDGDLALLAALLADEPAGRAFVGGGEVSPYERGLAALGLGRLATVTAREDVRRLAAHYLARGFETAPRARPEIAAACLVAIAQAPLERLGLRDPAGLPEPPNQSRIALLRFLVEQLENHKRLDDLVLVHAPAALACAYAALPPDARDDLAAGLAEHLLGPLERPRRHPDAFVQNALLAAGDLTRLDGGKLDRDLLDALFEHSDAADLQTRTCALLALGELLGRAGVDPASAPSQAVSDHLVKAVTRGRTTDRPAAALALGLAGATLRERGHSVPSRWAVTLRAALVQARSPEERVAIALASGLLRDTGAEPGLIAAFESAPARDDRSRIGVALGLLGSREALGPLREELDRTFSDASATRRTAEAAALCGDVSLPARLLDALGRSKARTERLALLDALAAVGGPAQLEALVALVGDETVDSGERARAARAVGRIADGERAPWTAAYAEHLVLSGAAPVLFDGQGRGVLERLP